MLGTLACAVLLAPQGPGEQDASPLLQLPAAPGVLATAPFQDLQGPVATPFRAAGVVDFTGSGNADAWFLGAAPGPFAGDLSVRMVRTGHVGRYRDWLTAPGNWSDAASFQHASMTRGQVLLADPLANDLMWGRVLLAPSGDPRGSTTWETGPTGFLPGVSGIREVVAIRRAGSFDHDRVATVSGTRPNESHLHLVALDANRVPSLAATGTVPLELHDLLPCDFDGDGDLDLLTRCTGLGLVLCENDGIGGLAIATVFPDPNDTLGTAFAGRIREGARDTIGAPFFGGIALVDWDGAGWRFEVLPRPAGTAPIAEVHVVPGEAEAVDVYGVPETGDHIVLHRYDGGHESFQPGVAVAAGDGTNVAWQGPGAAGRRSVLDDVDRDGDLDLLWQLPDRTRWLSVLNRAIDHRPRDVAIDYRGELPIGFKQFDFRVTLPEDWTPQSGARLEVHTFLRNRVTLRDEYWAEIEPLIDPSTRTATFTVFYTEDPFLTQSLHAAPGGSTAYQFGPDTLALGGKIAFSLHTLVGTRRGQAWHVDHDPDYDGHKSPGGVKWVMRAAPPLPQADDALLPW